jgi:hypothetical protein
MSTFAGEAGAWGKSAILCGGFMVTQNPTFFIINPASGRLGPQVRGKWLFFGEIDGVNDLMTTIDALVERGELQGALISRKMPGKDLFPHKDNVLCLYTTGDQAEIENARRVMVEQLGLAPALWKSDAQTFVDFGPEGWLKLESLIIEIRKDIADESTITSDYQIRKLKEYTTKLRTALKNADGDRKLEMELNHLAQFIEETEALLRGLKK